MSREAKERLEQNEFEGAVQSATAQAIDELINDFGLDAVVNAIIEIGESRKVVN